MQIIFQLNYKNILKLLFVCDLFYIKKEKRHCVSQGQETPDRARFHSEILYELFQKQFSAREV